MPYYSELVPLTFRPDPEDLCFSDDGWRAGADFLVLFSLQGLHLEEALGLLWEQHRGLLGVGTLCFKIVDEGPPPKGYLLFTPEG